MRSRQCTSDVWGYLRTSILRRRIAARVPDAIASIPQTVLAIAVSATDVRPRQTAALVDVAPGLQGGRPADDGCWLPVPVDRPYRPRSRRRPARPRWSLRKLDAVGESSRATGPGAGVHVTGSGVRSSDFAPSRLLLGFRGVSGSRRQHEPRRRDDGSYRPPPVVDWCLPGSRRRSAQRRWSRRKLDALAESSRAAAGQGQVCTSLEAACGRVEANFRTSAARPNWCTALQGAASRPVCDASLLRAHAVGRLNGAYLPVTCLRSTGILMKTRWGKQAHTWELATGDPQPFSF